MNVNVVLVLCMATLGATQNSPPITPYIVGGLNAKPGDIPWIVSLSCKESKGNHFCGGSILDSRTILTAAHCVEGFNAVMVGLKVRVGSLTINTGGIQYNVVTIRVHPNYKPNYLEGTIDNDVAILKTDTDMIVSGKINGIPVSPVRLPKCDELDEGTVVRVAGWGYFKPAGPALSTELQWVDVPMFDWFTCYLRYSFHINDEMVCAGEHGRDSCSGDSGGPLTKGDVIYGIISWGPFPCADRVLPGLYSNVVALRDWINKNRA